jgi:DNA-binding NarL/FixJ family response regulator
MTQTVLIVDDHPSFRASARAVLESGEFEVVGEAADGAGALEAVRSLRPDVILLDVQLPDMEGFDVCAELERSNGWAPSIVLVSSRDMADYGDLIASSCAIGFLPKAEVSPEALSAFLS